MTIFIVILMIGRDLVIVVTDVASVKLHIGVRSGNSNYPLFFKTSSLQLSCQSLPDTAPGTADGTS